MAQSGQAGSLAYNSALLDGLIRNRTQQAARERMLNSRLQNGLDFAARQAERILQKYPGYYPSYTVGGLWNREGERWTNWCEGFFPGILWLLHKHTGEARWRTAAEQYTAPLAP